MKETTTKPTNAKARAARQNGKNGGRPRARLPQAIIDRIGPAPTGNPLELNRWVLGVLACCLELQLRGELDRTVGASIRASAMAIARSIPPDVYAALDKKFRDSLAERDADDLGPAMEARTDVPSYRGAAR